MAEVNGDAAAPQTNGHLSASPPSAPAPSQPAAASIPVAQPAVPSTSVQDPGHGKRPRDARLIHMLLSSLGVTAYQERVPLQLLDFAYRHSSSILSDALHLSADAYLSQQNRARDAPAGTSYRDADGQVSANAVQLAISSRLQYQFSGGSGAGLSKEFLLETAQKRNAIALPRLLQNEWGVRLPSERFVLTGVPWGLKEEWPTDELESVGEDAMEGLVTGEELGVEDAEGGIMEDVFGTEDVDHDMDHEE
jgi:transcription initiation factor TFIID subunit 9B